VKIAFRVVELKLKHPFTIARGSSTTRKTVLVEFQHQGITGYGEAAPIQRYEETAETVAGFLKQCADIPLPDALTLDGFIDLVENISPGNYCAKASLDIAFHDWMGKKLSSPLWKYLGGESTRIPETSITIGMDSPEMIAQKLEEAREFPVLKVKLGGSSDEEIMKTIRANTDKPIRVDGNEGWKDRGLALERLQWLETQHVQFVEQPMPADQFRDLVWLRERSSLPLLADESVKTEPDIRMLRDAFDGINIKLMKCGGLREGKRMIDTARQVGMKVMIGCMIESSIGIAAGMSLATLADYADLDGNILISNDPFEGAVDHRGVLKLSDEAGLGVRPKKELWRQR